MHRMKKYLLYGIMIMALSGGAYAQSAKKIHKEALGLYLNNEFEQALKMADQTLAVDPNYFEALLLKGQIYNKLQRPEEALKSLDAAAIQEPGNEALSDARITTLELLRRYPEAIEICQQRIKQHPKDLDEYYRKAGLQLKSRDFSGMLQTAQNALAYRKDDDRSMFFQAVASDSLGNDLVAETYYKQALQLALEDKNRRADNAAMAQYYASLAHAQSAQFRYDDAVRNYNEAILRNATQNAWILERGKAQVAQKNYQAALQDFTLCIQHEPNSAEAYLNRAQVQVILGQFPNAQPDFNQVIRINPLDARAFAGRAACYEASGAFRDAVRDMKKAMELDASNKEYSKRFVQLREKEYEAGKEDAKPEIRITQPQNTQTEIRIKPGKNTLNLEGQILDASPLKNLSIDGQNIPVNEDERNPSFQTSIACNTSRIIEIKATDIYLNTGILSINLIIEESNPPIIQLERPFPGNGNSIFIPAADSFRIDGWIDDESALKAVTANGKPVLLATQTKRNRFTAWIPTANTNILKLEAMDEHGNKATQQFVMQRDDSSNVEGGKTWIISIENTRYMQWPDSTSGEDQQAIQEALNGIVHSHWISLRNANKSQMELFFQTELRAMVQNNRVKNLVIWYSGAGALRNGIGYWLPSDADTTLEHTWYSLLSLRAALEPCTSLNQICILSNSCDPGDGFLEALPFPNAIPECNTKNNGNAQAIALFSGQNSLSRGSALFTQTLAHTLRNAGACISPEHLALRLDQVSKQTKSAGPKFGKIKGLKNENGAIRWSIKKTQ
jgi:tetratricopeptide (TPR) repeat protein